MAIERPTFHESWYRVAELRPRIRSTVQITRQHFRGMPWHVVQDHSNNAFFRLAEPAYRFIGLLDGKRTVGDAWIMANEQLGDDAPTQGEVIQLLGQLYTSNLLQSEVPADAHTLFARYKKRKQREITSYLMNIMFARLPIFDPDRLLNKILPLVGWIFSPLGAIVWAILLAFGIHSVTQVSDWQSKITDQAGGLLSPQNLALLYVGFALIKACHEMGHAISCKKFGRQSGTGGEVHVIGIMFLVFTPVPYVDASSSWALRNKWHRAIVGAAGMWVELAIASVAAMVWARTADSHWLHAFAYNIMFVASFSTIVFNANPLLRYDGYYILSDLLEIPNLSQRGKDYIFYLVKKYLWNVRHARNPAHSSGEKVWLFLYAIASFIMRIVVTFSIMFYLTSVLDGTLIILATGMAIAGLAAWVLVPTGKFIHYLATSSELSRVRSRAVLSTLITVAALVYALGFFPAPHHERAQGVIEPANMVELFAREEGLVEEMPVDPAAALTSAPSREGGGGAVKGEVGFIRLAMPTVARDQVIVRARNLELETQHAALLAQRRELTVQRNAALYEDPGKAQIAQSQLDGINLQLSAIQDRLHALNLRAPQAGVLVAPPLESQKYGYLKRTDRLGLIADLHDLIVRAAVGNELSGPLEAEAQRQDVEIRVEGRPDILFSGHISATLKAGSNQLPSASLGYQVGGHFTTANDDREGTKTTEQFFEIRLDRLKLLKAPPDVLAMVDSTGQIPLLPGQRVVVRFTLKPKPLATQAWTLLLQTFQKNFQL